MPTYQSYNSRIKAYVKWEMYKGKAKILNVKQKEPTKPFKGVPIKKKK